MIDFDKPTCAPERGVIRARAGGVGAALMDARHMKIMYHNFSVAERASALTLKIRKCTIAP
eukprot:465525-Pyramimonas_sp.AAC.1